MMNSVLTAPLTCPYCPGSSRSFSAHGLKVHIGRMHKGALQPAVASQTVASDPLLAQNGMSSGSQARSLDVIATLKKSTPVLRHIPKGARNQAAGRLCEIVDKCVDCNEVEDWYALLTFAFSALRVPSKELPGNMTAKVKANIAASDPCHLGNDCGCESQKRGPRSSRSVIESKVFDGDLRGAIRLLTSNDSFAQLSPDTLADLKAKHPGPSRPLNFPPVPDASLATVSVTMDEVAQALGSFYSGSAAGLDGIRPGHLKELTSCSAGDNGPRLLGCLTKLSNFLLSGQLNVEVCPYLYGASLCALSKKGGGVRPIAIGSVFRRLVAKLGCRAIKEEMAEYLRPHQLGFGTRSGCEAAIHATRAFVQDASNSDCVVLKLDITNAFNTLERDVLLSEVKAQVPSLYPFLHQVYQAPSNLFFDNDLILSQVGAQQGDPLGPLVFSLAIHKAIVNVKSSLNLWYLDDGTIGGRPEEVFQDLQSLIPRLRELGLEVNPSKCEFFPCCVQARTHFERFNSLLPGLRELSPSSFYLLGSPIFIDALPEAILSQNQLLLTARERLQNLSAHVALVLLRTCFAIPKATYLLRTAPTWLCPNEVAVFDETLKTSIESILNVSLNDPQWTQAVLPIRHGGLGVRCMGELGLPAFLASAHGVAGLVSVILHNEGDEASIPFVSDARAVWSTLNSGVESPAAPHVQRAWDDVGANRVQKQLLSEAAGADLARLRAVSRSESGAWLHALPSPHLGTFLDDDSLRVAVGLRLGCKVCEPHTCICGSVVEADGHHALSCRRCTGRFPRHHALNDIVRRAFVSANIPCVLEPPGLSRSDGKRPDGLTLVPWKNGKCLVWDATCVSTVAACHLSRSIHSSAAAAEDAACRKRQKYAALEAQYLFVPIAVETLGAWGTEARVLIRQIGQRITEKCGDPRASCFLEQRLAIAIQRGNAASVLGTFAPGTIRGGLFD